MQRDIYTALADAEAKGQIARIQSFQRLLEENIGSLFTKAGVRKMIARLHEELALYEASEDARRSDVN